ncbi:protein LNK1-like isoform X3 [Nymphaea colorata]|uniref:protein LNK1-like isoform X3 n=1 Tax=Nymphaea colorata TaxID=210225 RepID=UPI00129E92B0|nr:protein LNK1-like isoform X3 [Nymphaea colorata]
MAGNSLVMRHLVSGGDIHEDKNHVSFPNMSPIVESSSTQSENFLSDMLVDSLSLMNDSSNITDVLNYWKSSTTSLETANSPDIWEEFNMEFSDHPSCSTLDLSDSTENAPTKTTFMRNSHGNASSFQRCITRASMPTDLQRFGDNEDTKADDEGSLEATVLYELETSMAQLNAKTRICFRDALYRLARNSWPQTAAKVAVDDICINSNGERELETNVIDRAIAKLLFNNVGHDTAQFSFPSSHGKKSVPKTARFHQKRRLATHPSVAEHEDSQEELSVTTINSF